MSAISVDSQGYAVQEGMFSAKAVARGLILLGALVAALLGIYWLASAPAEGGGEAAPVAAVAAPAEPLLTAPAATCVDGRPASADVPADACR